MTKFNTSEIIKNILRIIQIHHSCTLTSQTIHYLPCNPRLVWPQNQSGNLFCCCTDTTTTSTCRHVRPCQSRNGNRCRGCSCCCCSCCCCHCKFVKPNSSKCNFSFDCNSDSNSDSDCNSSSIARAVCQRLSSISSRSDVIDTIWIYIWMWKRIRMRKRIRQRVRVAATSACASVCVCVCACAECQVTKLPNPACPWLVAAH